MIKSLAAVAAASLLVLGSQSAMAATPDETNQWELTLLGSGTNDNDFNNGGFTVAGSLGYYYTPQWEIVGRQTAGYSDAGAGSSWAASTRLGVLYHFSFGQDQPIVPFVGANIGYTYGDSVSDSWVAGPEAGLKWYVNPTTFIYGSVAYDFNLQESFGDGQFVYGLGIGFRF